MQAKYFFFLSAKAVQRQSRPVSLRQYFFLIFFPSLLAFLWAIQLNVRYYENVFFCYGHKDSNGIYRHPWYNSWGVHHIFWPLSNSLLSLFQGVHSGFFYHLELVRPSNCKINRWVSCWSAHKRHCSIYSFQISSAWNGLSVWVTPKVKFDVIRVWRYWVLKIIQ